MSKSPRSPFRSPGLGSSWSPGLTLVELVVVIGILGILLSIAIPSYTSYRLRAGRTDARVALLAGAQSMERHFSRNNTYEGATIPGTVPATSEHGLYAISFDGAPTARSFMLKATAQGSQAGDTACATMTIDHLGRKPQANCW